MSTTDRTCALEGESTPPTGHCDCCGASGPLHCADDRPEPHYCASCKAKIDGFHEGIRGAALVGVARAIEFALGAGTCDRDQVDQAIEYALGAHQAFGPTDDMSWALNLATGRPA